MELKDKYQRKVARFKERIQSKERELAILLEITNAINQNQSTLQIIDKFEHFIKNELLIERAILFAKYKGWVCLLDYNVDMKVVDSLDVQRDLMHIKEITSVNALESRLFKDFDMVIPVYHGEKPLAYLIIGDMDEKAVGVSSIIKHLNFLQLLTNVILSAVENQRLAKEAIKQEREKQKLIEKQKEMLEIQVEERTKELRIEKEESERLLHNILPVEVATQLKQKGFTSAKSYRSVTMLFTDFKGFTETSSKITPRKLVYELNDIFKGFDNIMDQFGVEKIKTIGDAYMAVSGLPKVNKKHALMCVLAARKMLEFLEERGKRSQIKWQMRVGIHSGPLIAGVVGTKKFTYDVWGDTVNTAARMESGGEAGKINISQATRDLIKDSFDCKYRGKMQAKGKGEIDMYFITEEKYPSDAGRKQGKNLPIQGIKKMILGKMEEELPGNLFYHGLHHTIDMYNSAVAIAKSEKIKGRELDLIKIAALFHDSGFINKYKGHELEGCKLARKYLPEFGCSVEDIARICNMIKATEVPQNPENLLEQIICDADLDYLGTERFKKIGSTLFQELNAWGHKLDDKAWNKIQVSFLENHKYFTNTSKKLREPVKQEHLLRLKKQVNKY